MTITSEDVIYCKNCQGLKKYVRTIFCEEFEQVDLKKIFQQVSLKKNTSGPDILRQNLRHIFTFSFFHYFGWRDQILSQLE